MTDPPECAILQTLQRVIKGSEHKSSLTFTLDPAPDPVFFNCKDGEEVHLLFAYPEAGDASRGWWAQLLKDSPYDSGLEYQSFLHDGIMAMTVASEKNISHLHLYAVKITPRALASLEGEDPGFPVLPPLNPSIRTEEQGFCISGGIIRTRMFPDSGNYTKAGVITDKEGNAHTALFCAAAHSWVNLSWQGTKSGNVGYKMLAGTQVCIPEGHLAARARRVATLRVSK